MFQKQRGVERPNCRLLRNSTSYTSQLEKMLSYPSVVGAGKKKYKKKGVRAMLFKTSKYFQIILNTGGDGTLLEKNSKPFRNCLMRPLVGVSAVNNPSEGCAGWTSSQRPVSVVYLPAKCATWTCGGLSEEFSQAAHKTGKTPEWTGVTVGQPQNLFQTTSD